MGLVVALGVLAVGLCLVVFEQFRLSRMSPQQRAQVYARRPFGRRPQRVAETYRRRVVIQMSILALAGAAFIVLIATAPVPNHARGAVVSALVLIVILVVFGIAGFLNYRRISEDSKAGYVPQEDSSGPW